MVAIQIILKNEIIILISLKNNILFFSFKIIFSCLGVQHSASNLLGVAAAEPKYNMKRRGTLSKNTSRIFNVMNQRSKSLPSHFSFLDLLPEEVSEIMTKEDSRLFQNLNVDEFSGQAWSSKLDSGVGVLTHRWNKLGRWVASEIVNNGNHKQRLEILKRFVIILDDVFKNNNFFAAMAVLSGLNHSAVQRMKKTWRSLPEKYQKDLNHVEEELSFSQSFRRYRELLGDAVEKGKPCIPFLAVHTKDLLFINEAKGNPEFISPRVINFEKLCLIGNIVHQVLIFFLMEKFFHFSFFIFHFSFFIFHSSPSFDR